MKERKLYIKERNKKNYKKNKHIIEWNKTKEKEMKTKLQRKIKRIKKRTGDDSWLNLKEKERKKHDKK